MDKKTIIALSLLSLVATGTAQAGSSTISVAGSVVNAPVTSMREARFGSILLQQYDFSCGSAALASLLTFHYDRAVQEAEVFQKMYEVGDKAAIHAKGFSLLDMKKYLQSLQLDSAGFKVSLEQMSGAGVPAIALIDLKGYKHFVVVKGIDRDSVLVGDPALGLKVYAREEFEGMWNGIAFVITDEVEVARTNFDRESEWQVRPKAPVSAALVDQGLASFSRNLPGLNTF